MAAATTALGPKPLQTAVTTSKGHGRLRHHFTRLHLLRLSGRNAWSGGMVATSFT
jgi:hypothetical protein